MSVKVNKTVLYDDDAITIISKTGSTNIAAWSSIRSKLLSGELSVADTVWEDLRFPSQGISILGFATDPDPEATSGLLLFDSASTETLWGVAQLPHAWKEGTTIKPHVHWAKTTSAAGDVYWQLEYETVANGAVAAMDYGTAIGSAAPVAGTPDGDTANECLITALGDIAMTGLEVSCLVFWKLSRVHDNAADDYAADARLIELDFHYEVSSLGSSSEFTK